MRLDKQKDTSRRNGARSRGPVTAAGKQRSSANSYKHGIGSRALLIPGESQADLDAHFGGYRDRFNPADAVELGLVDNRAFITWRQRRLWRREADIVTLRTEYEPKANSDAQREAASEAWRDMRIRGQAEYPCVGLIHHTARSAPPLTVYRGSEARLKAEAGPPHVKTTGYEKKIRSTGRQARQQAGVPGHQAGSWFFRAVGSRLAVPQFPDCRRLTR